MTRDRSTRIAELKRSAMRARDRADAFDLLAHRLVSNSMPVERWREFWQEVADDVNQRARDARRYARECDEHAATLDAADAARIAYERRR